MLFGSRQLYNRFHQRLIPFHPSESQKHQTKLTCRVTHGSSCTSVFHYLHSIISRTTINVSICGCSLLPSLLRAQRPKMSKVSEHPFMDSLSEPSSGTYLRLLVVAFLSCCAIKLVPGSFEFFLWGTTVCRQFSSTGPHPSFIVRSNHTRIDTPRSEKSLSPFPLFLFSCCSFPAFLISPVLARCFYPSNAPMHTSQSAIYLGSSLLSFSLFLLYPNSSFSTCLQLIPFSPLPSKLALLFRLSSSRHLVVAGLCCTPHAFLSST